MDQPSSEAMTVPASPEPEADGIEEAPPEAHATLGEADLPVSLPQPSVNQTMRELDPQLYEYWREHVRQGFERNDEMFQRIVRGFMRPYHYTVAMYIILFAVGVLMFVAAAVLSIVFQEPLYGLILGGLGVVAFLTFFISRPLQALEENLNLITWLGIVYNTYWTRLLYSMDQNTVQGDLEDATQDAIKEIKQLLDKHSELSGKRPGLR